MPKQPLHFAICDDVPLMRKALRWAIPTPAVASANRGTSRTVEPAFIQEVAISSSKPVRGGRLLGAIRSAIHFI